MQRLPVMSPFGACAGAPTATKCPTCCQCRTSIHGGIAASPDAANVDFGDPPRRQPRPSTTVGPDTSSIYDYRPFWSNKADKLTRPQNFRFDFSPIILATAADPARYQACGLAIARLLTQQIVAT
jgi:hypothetical protein